MGTILEWFIFKNKILLKKTHFKFSTLFIALFFNQLMMSSQINSNVNFGVKLGIVAQFGTPINQIGVRLDGYAAYQCAQLNLGNVLTFSFANLANRKQLFENRLSLGAILLGGTRSLKPDFIWDGLRHQTNYQNAIGYNYIWYRDNQNSSQNSGGWTLQFSNFQLFFENDIFAGTGRDKFRTGHLMLGYRYGLYNFQIGTKLWTGETRGSKWQKTPLDKCPSGYRILEDLSYGKSSHGIFYGGLTYSLPYGNYFSGQIGFDAEQVRHLFQNRLSHDMILFPEKIERKTPHYPRLDENGHPVFEKSKVRKTKPYAEFGVNPIWSY